MGSSLFSWATDLTELCSTSDYSQFFNHYFIDTDVLTWTFVIGLGIAVVIGLIFYLVICNKSFALSTRLNWLIALIITAVATFFVSSAYMKGSDGGDASSSSGFFLDSYTYQDDVAQDLEDNDDQLAEWNASAEDFRQGLSTGDFDIITKIALVNMGYSLLIFILLSLCLKGTTVHGKNIPI